MTGQTDIKHTPLYRLHLELGGKMTAFAGYQLPVQYPAGIIREHLHCRRYAGFFDISHMGQFLVTGDSAVAGIERLTPSQLCGLKPGQQKYTVLTNDQGGVIDDIIVTRIQNGLKLVVNAACKEKDYEHLKSSLSGHCHLMEQSGKALFALQGPAACSVINQYSEIAARLPFMHACATALKGISCTISRCGYTGEDGFEISVANEHAEALARRLLAEKDVLPIGLGARDTLRLEAGLCLYGHELDENITPVEAGLNWLIKQDRDNYPGADTILRQLQQGTEFIRAGLIVESKVPVREGCIILDQEKQEIGAVTSGTFSPSLNKPVAMARLNNRFSRAGMRLFAKVREQFIPVTVVPLPFIPHRYHR